MKTKSHYINGFKNRFAFNAFMSEAIVLETNLSRNISYGRCETLYLFVNDNTGKIVTWYREHDPAAGILDEHNDQYSRIPWQVRGVA
ncbi:MAG: hypothetical protein ABH875_07130 [Candidatus Omnitrophota bacterium]